MVGFARCSIFAYHEPRPAQRRCGLSLLRRLLPPRSSADPDMCIIQHNPQVKKKMRKEDWIHNTKLSLNQALPIPWTLTEDTLSRMYDDVTRAALLPLPTGIFSCFLPCRPFMRNGYGDNVCPLRKESTRHGGRSQFKRGREQHGNAVQFFVADWR